MTGKRRTRVRGAFSLVLVAIVVLGALATAGLAGAAARTVHVKVTKKAISISGSRSAPGQVVQINYDSKTCASYATEVKRETEFSDFRSAKLGAFSYAIRRSRLHLDKPAHYACVFLIALKGNGFVQVAAASAKL